VWIFYPTSASGTRWAPIAWVGLGINRYGDPALDDGWQEEK
jgi:hypothetical protein